MKDKKPPIGETIQTWDYDDNRWTDSIVHKIEDDKAFLELTDRDSEFQGLEWDEPISELKWRIKE